MYDSAKLRGNGCGAHTLLATASSIPRTFSRRSGSWLVLGYGYRARVRVKHSPTMLSLGLGLGLEFWRLESSIVHNNFDDAGLSRIQGLVSCKRP